MKQIETYCLNISCIKFHFWTCVLCIRVCLPIHEWFLAFSCGFQGSKEPPRKTKPSTLAGFGNVSAPQHMALRFLSSAAAHKRVPAVGALVNTPTSVYS